MARTASRGKPPFKTRRPAKKEDAIDTVSRIFSLVFAIAMAILFIGIIVHLGPMILTWMFENGLTRPVLEP